MKPEKPKKSRGNLKINKMKKLTLNKKVFAKLTPNEESVIKGGTDFSCVEDPSGNCVTASCAGCNVTFMNASQCNFCLTMQYVGNGQFECQH